MTQISLQINKGIQQRDTSNELAIRCDHEFDKETFIRPHMIHASFSKGSKKLLVHYYDKSGKKVPLKSRLLKPRIWVVSPKELCKIHENFAKTQLIFCVSPNIPNELNKLHKLFAQDNKTTICLSAMGYFQQVWYDGWMGIWHNHDICALLPPGTSGSLKTPFPVISAIQKSELNQDFFDKNWQLQASLIARLRKKKPLSTSFFLESSGKTKFDEFAIILLRLAFPARVFYFPETLFSGKKLARIKKYCQPIIFIKNSSELAHNSTHICLNEEEISGKISPKKKDDLYDYFLNKLGFKKE